MQNGVFSNMDWSNWLEGILAALIGGGSSAIVSGVTINLVDPNHFNPMHKGFYILIGAMFLSNGLLNMFAYLKQNPLPTVKTVTDSVKRTTDPTGSVTTHTEQTKTGQ
jgi:hypothetical protein